MEATLSMLLERANGLFSRGFVLRGLLPAILFLVLNASLALWVFPANWSFADALVALDGLEQLLFWGLLLLFIYVLGLVLAAINPWLTKLLQGHFLPRWLTPPVPDAPDDADTETAVYREYFNYEEALEEDGWMAELRAARAQGMDRQPAPADLPQPLLDRYEAIRLLAVSRYPVPFEDMKALFTLLKDTLQEYASPANSRLARMIVEFYRLLQYAYRRADMAVERAKREKAFRRMWEAPRHSDPGRTRLSSMVAAHEEHTRERYGMDVELFWPRLLKFAQADGDFYPVLEDVKSQLDFSIAVTFVVGITAFSWLVITLFRAPGPTPYIVVAGIGLPLAYICYRIVLQSYLEFSRTAQAALDLYRFDLLKALHLGLPQEPEAEHRCWKELNDWVLNGAAGTLRFEHTPKEETRIVFPPSNEQSR